MNTGTDNYDISECLHFLEEADSSRITFAYPVGKHVGVRDVRSNDMKFIRLSDLVKEVTALTMSANGKYLAVAETHTNDKCPYATIFDMHNPFFKHAKSTFKVTEAQSN